MQAERERSLSAPEGVAEALAVLGQGGAVLAGGTWLMRAPGGVPGRRVSPHRIPALGRVDVAPDRITIGAAVTHAALAAALAGVAGVEALAQAAGGAANPAIRRVATVGGNLCTPDFAAADLPPALLACYAEVELETASGPLSLPLAAFLDRRRALLPGALLSQVVIRRDLRISAHARLPLRRAGDYPVAIVSMAQTGAGEWRVAVGSVEPVARRWGALEQALSGPPDPEAAAALAARLNDFTGRDGIEAEGWYRCQVLPALVRRCVQAMIAGEGRPCA